MNIRNPLFYSLLLILIAPAAQAQSGFSSVTPERVAELEMMHQRAMDSLLKNDFQGAIRAYSDILLVEPDDETAYTGLGQIYLVQGHYKEANEAFRNALHINSENEVALAGIRKIMDPDGVEGMTSRVETENEGMFQAAVEMAAATPGAPPLEAPAQSYAGAEKRLSAVKIKKGTLISKPAPKPSAPVLSAAPRAPRPGKLGLLHAQRTQMALKNAGFYSGPVNGLIGGSTKKAIREFQKSFGIEASGRMTAVTWTKLSEYLNTR